MAKRSGCVICGEKAATKDEGALCKKVCQVCFWLQVELRRDITHAHNCTCEQSKEADKRARDSFRRLIRRAKKGKK